jgi:predicted transcriptional regulator of viral defense system
LLAESHAGRYFLQVMDIARTSDYLVDLAARGRHHFTTEEAAAALGRSVPAVRAALRRLKSKGEIADPHRGFHVIVPPEYRRIGCLPAEQFIDQLMAHLQEPYYVALLSAAELHGAAHQRPQALQVMLGTNRRPIVCGQVRVQFLARKDMAQTPIVTRNTQRGPLRLASAEATALELVGYADLCGGLDHVASVLAELGEVLESERLLAECGRSPIAWVQRLGYLLDLTGHEVLAQSLVATISTRARGVAPLVRSATRTGMRRDMRWRLAVNASLEPDL